MKTSPFFKQADLVVQLIPFVNAETCFALKGGTAINFFVRNFPRLSVDIDLVYESVEDRETTLRGINAALQRMADRIRRSMPTAQVTERNLPGQNLVVKDQHQPSPPGKQIVPCHLQMTGEVGIPHGHPGNFVQQQHRPSSCRQEAGQELKRLRPALQRNLGSFGLISQSAAQRYPIAPSDRGWAAAADLQRTESGPRLWRMPGQMCSSQYAGVPRRPPVMRFSYGRAAEIPSAQFLVQQIEPYHFCAARRRLSSGTKTTFCQFRAQIILSYFGTKSAILHICAKVLGLIIAPQQETAASLLKIRAFCAKA